MGRSNSDCDNCGSGLMDRLSNIWGMTRQKLNSALGRHATQSWRDNESHLPLAASSHDANVVFDLFEREMRKFNEEFGRLGGFPFPGDIRDETDDKNIRHGFPSNIPPRIEIISPEHFGGNFGSDTTGDFQSNQRSKRTRADLLNPHPRTNSHPVEEEDKWSSLPLGEHGRSGVAGLDAFFRGGVFDRGFGAEFPKSRLQIPSDVDRHSDGAGSDRYSYTVRTSTSYIGEDGKPVTETRVDVRDSSGHQKESIRRGVGEEVWETTREKDENGEWKISDDTKILTENSNPDPRVLDMFRPFEIFRSFGPWKDIILSGEEKDNNDDDE
eukprot:701513_1